VACVLPGARSTLEFDDNATMAKLAIPTDFWQVLRERSLVDPSAPLPGATKRVPA
jgi:hypothetical protein